MFILESLKDKFLNPEKNEMLGLIARLMKDQGRKHWKSYIIAFICMAAVAGSTSTSAWIMRDVIDKVFIAKQIDALWIIAAILICVSLTKGFATYWQQVTLSRVANAIIANVQKRIFDKMLTLSVNYYHTRHSSEFVARQSFIGNSCSLALNQIITSLSRDIFTLIGLTAVMIIQDPLMSILAIVFMPIAIYGTRKIARKARKIMSTEFTGFSQIMESMQEVSHGIRVVKSYTLENFMRERQFTAIQLVERASNKLSEVSARSSPLMETLGGLAVASIVIYGGWRVIYSNHTPGAFFSFITAVLMAYEPAKRVSRLQVDLSASLRGVGMFYEFLEEKDTEINADHSPDLIITHGRVQFENVTFCYREGEPIINQLNFNAENGKTTALVGPSGGGKSTIMSLILRYWTPQSGLIKIDDQNIINVALNSLRHNIAYVSQDVFLFNGTIKENIALGKIGASDDEIIQAAKLAYADDFITAFEQGYDTHCGENGIQLSGGQRQRISIARAILKNAPILLLDEATSALDNESERKIQMALEQLTKGRTTIVIAHRLTTIQKADKICFVKNGRITEEGSHSELVQKGADYNNLIMHIRDHESSISHHKEKSHI